MPDPWVEARSAHWEQRAKAAKALAVDYRPGDHALDAILHTLLLDEQDTGVSCAAVEALLRVGTVDAAKLVFAAIAQADFNTRLKVSGVVRDCQMDGLPVRELAEQLHRDEQTDDVSKGAAQVLEWVPESFAAFARQRVPDASFLE